MNTAARLSFCNLKDALNMVYDDGGVGGGVAVGWCVVAVVKMAVEARGIVDRLDPVKRSIFEVGRRTRRKVIPAAGDGGRRRWPDMGGEGESKIRCFYTSQSTKNLARESLIIVKTSRRRCSRVRSGYQQKDRKPIQNDKTEHGMEKTVQNQGQSPKMPKSESIQKNQQSNRSRTEEYYWIAILPI
ncbi:hypothetical protein Tco_1430107 [Tanacetum coccineum]